MDRYSCRSRRCRQTSSLRLQAELLDSLHFLGRRNRRRVLHNGQPWHRSADCATTAGGAQPEAIGDCVAHERRGDSVSVYLVPDCGRNAVGFLSRALRKLRKGRSDLPDLHRQPDAAWNFRPADCSGVGRGDVESERGAEFVVFHFHHGFLRALPSQSEERTKMRLSRISTILWALLLFALAVLSLRGVGRVVEVGLQIASVAYGALLGVFLLGVLTTRANQSGAMVGMVFGFSAELYLWRMHVPWTWWVMIGTAVTFVVGYAASFASILAHSDHA